MIDIITTRFREAYTWIIPVEHENHRSASFKRELSITSIKRFNEERRRMISLEEEDVKFLSNVIIIAFARFGCGSMKSTLTLFHIAEIPRHEKSRCIVDFAFARTDLSRLLQELRQGE